LWIQSIAASGKAKISKPLEMMVGAQGFEPGTV